MIVVFGEIEGDTGAARLRTGQTSPTDGDTHARFGMTGCNGPLFRYLIAEKLCFWWTYQGDAIKACAEASLARQGYEVAGHPVMAGMNPDFFAAHRRN